MFEIGDKAVYPGHGVGVIEAIETKQPIKNLVIGKGILSREEAELMFDLEKISKNLYQKPGKKKHGGS